MVRGRPLETEFRYLAGDGGWVSTTLGAAVPADVVRGRPVRGFPTYQGQRNYPGWLWLETTGSLVGYESLLGRDRLWLADFERAVVWVASQPFWISGRDESVLRRHVPDFLLETATGYLVVDVKPAELLSDPAVLAVMSWTRQLCDAKGWTYEVWSGADLVVLRNVRYLAVGRRRTLVDDAVLGKVAEAGVPGMTVAQVEAAAGVDASRARSATLSLLWSGRWATDLSRPLSGDSVLERVA